MLTTLHGINRKRYILNSFTTCFMTFCALSNFSEKLKHCENKIVKNKNANNFFLCNNIIIQL